MQVEHQLANLSPEHRLALEDAWEIWGYFLQLCND